MHQRDNEACTFEHQERWEESARGGDAFDKYWGVARVGKKGVGESSPTGAIISTLICPLPRVCHSRELSLVCPFDRHQERAAGLSGSLPAVPPVPRTGGFKSNGVGLGPFFRVAVPLHTTWTLSRSGVTKSISVDDSHLFVYVPSDYPELVTSVDPRGVQPEMGLAGRGPVRVGGSR